MEKVVKKAVKTAEKPKISQKDVSERKKAYDYVLATEFANKVKSKMKFALNVSGANGHKISKNEEEAIAYGFNYAISSCGNAINEVLKEYEKK